MEKLNNMTCGECRYHKNNRCMLPCYTINHPAENSACHRFEKKTPITNGDIIRAMSDEELATWGFYDLGACPTFEKKSLCPKRGDCDATSMEKCWLEWLKKEVKDE